jgi:hypothetical protein
MDAKQFGNYIRELRLKKKMTIRKLSLISGVSIARMSHIENGINGLPKPDTMQKLASALNIPHESLMVAAGHSRNGDTAIVELAKNFNELVESSKQVNLKDFEQYKFMIDEEEVPPELLKMMLDQIHYILSQRK